MSLSLSIFTKLVSERPIGRRAVGGSCLRGNLARLTTGRDERSGTRVKGMPSSPGSRLTGLEATAGEVAWRDLRNGSRDAAPGGFWSIHLARMPS